MMFGMEAIIVAFVGGEAFRISVCSSIDLGELGIEWLDLHTSGLLDKWLD